MSASSPEERRRAIVDMLEGAAEPVSGAELARACGVSRQVVVQDVALLRSQGVAVVATARGYVLDRPPARPRRLFKCRHTVDQSADELRVMVDAGGHVEDVFVNHRVYGKVSSKLDIASRRDVDRFMEDIRTGRSAPLMQITSGYHFHHVSAPSEEALDEIERELGARGFLAPLTDYEREAFDRA